MKIKRIVIFTLALMVSLSVVTCDPGDKDKIKLIVLCDGTFQGTYIYNGNTPVGFGGSSTENPYHQTGSSYYYEKVFNDLDSLEVDTTRDYCTDSLQVKIYREDTKVKEEVLDANSDSSCTNNYINLPYEYGEEEDTSNTQ